MIEICTVGGFSEVGRNCVAVRVDDEVVIVDMGLHLENYISYTESEDELPPNMTPKKLMDINAVPDINHIEDWRKDVVAIVPSHAHLDHIGAIPFLARRFKADIICTPFAREVLLAMLHDERIELDHDIISIKPNGRHCVSDRIEIEFIGVTHSIPETTSIAIHTPYGTVIYSNDFKLDSTPTLGPTTNIKRLKELGDQGVACLIMDSLNSTKEGRTPSEKTAQDDLEKLILEDLDTKGKGIIITTFSSHIARLRAIVRVGHRLRRRVLFLGRSLSKYVDAAQATGIERFENVEIVKYKRKIKRRLKEIEHKKEKFLIVCTGHQGEPKSVLSRMISANLPYRLDSGDYVIFSCKVIPTETNIRARAELDAAIKAKGANVFTDVHVSGHASSDEHRELIGYLRPKILIPSHGTHDLVAGSVKVAQELGYKLGKTVVMMRNGERLRIV